MTTRLHACPLILLAAVMSTAAVAFAMAAYSAFAADGSPSATPTVWGDVTCDNAVNPADVADLMRRSSGIEKFPGCASSQAPMTARLDAGSGAAKPGDAVTISVYADSTKPGVGIGFAAFDVVYDPQVLTPVSCDANSGGCNTAIAAGTARWGLIAFGENGWVGETKLGSIQFVVGGTPGQTTKVTLQNTNFGDQHGVAIPGPTSSTNLLVLPADATPAPTVSATPPPDSYWQPADINCDGAITVADALGVLEYVAVGQSSLPVQGPCPAIGS